MPPPTRPLPRQPVAAAPASLLFALLLCLSSAAVRVHSFIVHDCASPNPTAASAAAADRTDGAFLSPDGIAAVAAAAPTIATPRSRGSSCLRMARGGPGGGGRRRRPSASQQPPGKKKKKANKRTGTGPGGKHRKTSNKRDRNAPANEGRNGQQQQPPSSKPSAPRHVALPNDSSASSSSSRGPPWQIMSQKDQKHHIQAEVERREKIKAGEADSGGSSGSAASSSASSASAASAGGRRFVPKADISVSNSLLSPSDRSLLSWKRFNPTTSAGGVAYIGSYLGKDLPPSLGVPEVAFLGRSNVGKSSLLNKLTEGAVSKGGGGGGAGDRARVGKTPGATASVNLYSILGRAKSRGGNAAPASPTAASKPILGLADLPGFGYAKLSKDVKLSVEEAAERYLGRRKELALGVLLVDARRIPSDDDRAVLAALFDMGVPIVVAATKVDKFASRDKLATALELVRDGLGLPDGQPLCVSSVTGAGTGELWRIILDACETKVEELRKEAEGGGGGGGGAEEDEEDGGDVAFEDGEDVEYSQGYEWLQSYGREDDGPYDHYEDDERVQQRGGVDDWEDDYYNEPDDDGIDDGSFGPESRAVTDAENRERQAAANEALKLRNLKKVARRLERRGEV